jgi:hypothetical protein
MFSSLNSVDIKSVEEDEEDDILYIKYFPGPSQPGGRRVKTGNDILLGTRGCLPRCGALRQTSKPNIKSPSPRLHIYDKSAFYVPETKQHEERHERHEGVAACQDVGRHCQGH